MGITRSEFGPSRLACLVGPIDRDEQQRYTNRVSMANNANPGCLGALFALLGLGRAGSGPAGSERLPYRLRDDFLSPAERSFFGVLSAVAGVRAVVCPKVRVGDLVFVPRSEPRRAMGHRNRINQKHVDFVLCAPHTMKPLLVVELDDAKSHGRPDRAARDAFVDAVFEAAGLPVLHVPVQQRGYVPAELSARLDPLLSSAAASAGSPPPAVPLAAAATPAALSPPTCPKCGVAMVVRTAARGERQGQSFFGCPNYPQCRRTRPFLEPVREQEQPST